MAWWDRKDSKRWNSSWNSNWHSNSFGRWKESKKESKQQRISRAEKQFGKTAGPQAFEFRGLNKAHFFGEYRRALTQRGRESAHYRGLTNTRREQERELGQFRQFIDDLDELHTRENAEKNGLRRTVDPESLRKTIEKERERLRAVRKEDLARRQRIRDALIASDLITAGKRRGGRRANKGKQNVEKR